MQVGAAVGHAEACIALLRALAAPGVRAAVLAATSDGEEVSSGETALHLACLEGHAACVEAILEEVSRRGGACTHVCTHFWGGVQQAQAGFARLSGQGVP